MACIALRTGLAITLAVGLLTFAPPDGLGRGSGGRSSGISSRLYSSEGAYRSPTASSCGSTKYLTCERDSSTPLSLALPDDLRGRTPELGTLVRRG